MIGFFNVGDILLEVPKQGQSKVLDQGLIDVCFHFNKVFSLSLALAMRKTKHMVLNLFTHGEALILAGAGLLLLCRYLHRTSFMNRFKRVLFVYFCWLVFYTD